MNSADSKQLLSKDSPSPGTALCEISELRNEVERHLTGIENAGGVLDLEKLSDLQAEQLQMTDETKEEISRIKHKQGCQVASAMVIGLAQTHSPIWEIFGLIEYVENDDLTTLANLFLSRFTEEEVDDPAQLEPIASSLSILSGFSRCDKILQSIIDSFSPELKQSILHSTPLTHKTALLLHFLRDDSDPKSSDPPANTSPSFLTCSSDVNDGDLLDTKTVIHGSDLRIYIPNSLGIQSQMTMGIFCCHHTPEGKKITVYDDTEKLRGEINTFDIVIIDSDLVPVEILDLAEGEGPAVIVLLGGQVGSRLFQSMSNSGSTVGLQNKTFIVTDRFGEEADKKLIIDTIRAATQSGDDVMTADILTGTHGDYKVFRFE